VTFTFPDDGGRLASVILNVEKFDSDTPKRMSFPGVIPPVLPVTIEAENFDTGGEGVAYHDEGAVNNGGEYREQGVDIASSTTAPYFVTSAVAGEWLEYTVRTPGDGYFQIQTVVSSGTTAGSLWLEFNGERPFGLVEIPATGADTWTTLSNNVSLAAGETTVRILVESGNLDIDKFTISSLTSVAGVSLNTDTVTTRVGKTVQLVATVVPDFAQEKSVQWISSDEAIATIDSDGLVTAQGEGEATVYVTTNVGGFQDSAYVLVRPGIVDTAYFASPVPTSYNSGAPITARVSYAASEVSDIYIELYDPPRTQWLGNARVTVPEGEGTVEVTLNRDPLPADTGYRLSASIRPEGTGWQQIKASQTILIDIVEEETVAFINLPLTFPSQQTYDFSVAYVADTARDIVVEIYTPDRGQWLGNAKATVPAGKDTVTVSIALSESPDPAENYDLTAALRPVGASWQQNIKVAQQLVDIVPRGNSNQFVNADFEEGNLSGWVKRGDVSVVTDSVYDGEYSAKIVSDGSVSQYFEVEPSANYVVSMAGRAQPGQRALLGIETYPDKSWLKTVVFNTEDWVEKATEITVPDTVSQLNVYLYVEAGNTAWADNFSVAKRVPATGIALNVEQLDLSIGDTTTLTPTFSPTDANNQRVTWVSDNPSVVSVDEQGLVGALADGTAQITATAQDGGWQATATVKVGGVSNLARNNGFETGDFTSWTNRSSQIVSTDTYDGAYSA
ncbi:MAG: Ig-like domain-containing protein, partial [Bacteroidota bacterium]